MKLPALGIASDLHLHWGNRFTSKRDVPWHRHAETELVAVTKGKCRIWVGEQIVLEGVRGALFVLPANVAQYQETMGITRTTYIGFDAPPGLFDDSARVLNFDPADPVLRWIEQLCDSRLTRPPLSNDVTRSLLAALLRRIDDVDVATGFRAQLHSAVQLAHKYLESHLSQSLTLAEVAFAAEFGAGPIQYLKRLRIERACWLLSNPYLRVHEVAEACGYDDVNYFTRLFRQVLGIAPGRWRAERRDGRGVSARPPPRPSWLSGI
jgi:AraC-like DNA-binding protein